MVAVLVDLTDEQPVSKKAKTILQEIRDLCETRDREIESQLDTQLDEVRSNYTTQLEELRESNLAKERAIEKAMKAALCDLRDSKAAMRDAYKKTLDEKWNMVEDCATVVRCKSCDVPCDGKGSLCAKCLKLSVCVLCETLEHKIIPADSICEICSGAVCITHETSTTCDSCGKRPCSACFDEEFDTLECTGETLCESCCFEHDDECECRSMCRRRR